MGAVAFALLWLGYSTAYYGYNRITGGNNTFKQLVWPGAYTPVARDDGSGGSTSSATTSSSAKAPTNTNTSPGAGQTVPGKTVQPK